MMKLSLLKAPPSQLHECPATDRRERQFLLNILNTVNELRRRAFGLHGFIYHKNAI
jgi:hypothetical protein